MPSGLFRLEDEHGLDGPQTIDLHPVQVQVLASFVGFTMPDRTREALDRLARRLRCLHEQADELQDLLNRALIADALDVAPEAAASQFIAHNLGELLADPDAIQAAEFESLPDAPANSGGQLSLLA